MSSQENELKSMLQQGREFYDESDVVAEIIQTVQDRPEADYGTREQERAALVGLMLLQTEGEEAFVLHHIARWEAPARHHFRTAAIGGWVPDVPLELTTGEPTVEFEVVA